MKDINVTAGTTIKVKEEDRNICGHHEIYNELEDGRQSICNKRLTQHFISMKFNGGRNFL